MRRLGVRYHGYEYDFHLAGALPLAHPLQHAERHLLAEGVHRHHCVRPVGLDHAAEALVPSDVHKLLRKEGREKGMEFAALAEVVC